MFVSVKSLTEALDQEFIYLADGVASKEAHSKEDTQSNQETAAVCQKRSELCNAVHG